MTFGKNWSSFRKKERLAEIGYFFQTIAKLIFEWRQNLSGETENLKFEQNVSRLYTGSFVETNN